MSAAAECVIGGILLAGKPAYWRVADMLTAEDFPSAWLSAVYRVCGDVARSDADLDVITAGEEMERRGVAGQAEVISLAANTPSAANIRAYAELVKQDAIARRVRAICAQGAKTGDLPAVQTALSALTSTQPSRCNPARDVVKRMWDGILARYEAGEALTGLSTGVPLLDEWTGGLQPGRVYGIGARAKMGKTVLAMNICAHNALAGRHVAVWSLEMSDEELMQRMVCALAGVRSILVQRPTLLDAAPEAMSRLHEATKRLREASLWISDRTDVTIEDIEAQARQMHAGGKLDLLCIDYLGLLRLPKTDRHDLAIAHVTRRLKVIAKELGIPVLLVFQLNRGSETGSAVRAPRPSDARDSGAIEQDLDAMLLLHRPHYYDPTAPAGLRLDLALQRNGPTGQIALDEELECCRFTGGTSVWRDAKPRFARENDL